MEQVTAWSLLVGLVFTLAALARGPLRNGPVSMPAIYLLVGALIGPWGIGLLKIDLIQDVKTIEALAEVAVLISLLNAGLFLKPSWKLFWRAPIPLASLTMVLTIAGLAAVGYLALALPIGAAVLLGAVLAPTDPVLAGDVQVRHHQDTNRLRFALTGEAGLNDGAAFPFIMLGLGLLGLHEIGPLGWRWVVVDLVWATLAGLGSGWLCGFLISRAAVWLKRSDTATAACEELLTLGMIGLSYGIALWIHAYGFLAVFAAGVAVRRYAENSQSRDEADDLMKTVTGINVQFGKIIEVALVVLVGALVTQHWTIGRDWWIALLLFFVLRPLSTLATLCRKDIPLKQMGFIAFFGIRGIGSLYYLSYAIDEGMQPDLALRLGGIVLCTIVLSLLIHSNTAKLLMQSSSK